MYIWIVGAVLVLGGLGFAYVSEHPSVVRDADRDTEVRSLVAQFGAVLQKVSLTEPDATSTLDSVYAPYVSQELIAAWKNNLETAPGRRASSPWPERIDIGSVTRGDDGSYEVVGTLYLSTGVGSAGTIPVSLTVRDQGGVLRIVQYEEILVHEPEPTPGSVVEVTVALGQSISALGIRLAPLSIIEDSRCPTDVACIQAGTVRLSATYTDNAGTLSSVFPLGERISEEAAYVTLVRVTPEKVFTTPFESSEYRFTFRVESR